MTDTEQRLRFCSRCGARLHERQLHGETVSRMVCMQCGTVAYRNPGILVTTIVENNHRILLCRRAEPPGIGYWTLPGGFMECGESLEQAAVRETFEETGIELDPVDLRFYGISSLVDISQVYIGFLTRLVGDKSPVCGHECQEVRFFAEQEMPWDSLAFPDLERYLRSFFRENRRGEHRIHFGHLNAETALRDVFEISSSSRSYMPRGPGSKECSE